ncbi:MAG TPA: hypothetical protein VFY81_05440 [Gammaproteobacteria bacterium]|nr:hypothetical protein [Gammaproteobacteria bacterium]
MRPSMTIAVNLTSRAFELALANEGVSHRPAPSPESSAVLEVSPQRAVVLLHEKLPAQQDARLNHWQTWVVGLEQRVGPSGWVVMDKEVGPVC